MLSPRFHSPPQRLALVTVHVVPPVAAEDGLVEEGAVAAQERAALVTLTAVVAHVIGLEKDNAINRLN